MKKKKPLKIFAVFGLTILNTLLISCVTSQTPGSHAKSFNPGHGFSYQLPEENTWEIEKHDNNILALKKLPGQTFRSFHVSATEFVFDYDFKNPENFLAFIKKTKGINSDPDRYEIINSDYILRPEIAPLCVNYKIKWKDYAAVNKGNNSYLITEATGYILLHPDDSKSGLDIYHSERYAKENDPALQMAGDEFLKTLKILPLK